MCFVELGLGFGLGVWVPIKRNPLYSEGRVAAVSVFSLSGARLWVRVLGVAKKKSPFSPSRSLAHAHSRPIARMIIMVTVIVASIVAVVI